VEYLKAAALSIFLKKSSLFRFATDYVNCVNFVGVNLKKLQGLYQIAKAI
jgi:hypothetical protein